MIMIIKMINKTIIIMTITMMIVNAINYIMIL